MKWLVTYLRGKRNRTVRKTSDSKVFPFTDLRVPIMLVEDDQVTIANSITDKILLLGKVGETDSGVLLAPWPGRHRTDVFVIDEPDYMRMQTILSENLKQ
jgi:hypothetical protein